MTQNALIRPAWTPATIGLMVLGFMAYWPLGLAMIGYILWGDRLTSFKQDVNRVTDKAFSAFGRVSPGSVATGNVAFDEWRSAELDRLSEERAKLDTMRDEFDTYARELRRAKDQEHFERFMNARKTSSRKSASKKKSDIVDL